MFLALKMGGISDRGVVSAEASASRICQTQHLVLSNSQLNSHQQQFDTLRVSH